MIRSHAHNTAGANAVAARVRVAATHCAKGLGYGWPTVASACTQESNADFSFMATTGNKRPPRRLGQRST